MYKQLTLTGDEITVYSKKEWFDMFVKHCEKLHFEEGERTGAYCCSYHWCCDKCRQEVNCGCADCVATIIQILKENNIEIDYSNIDFEYYENLAKEYLK